MDEQYDYRELDGLEEQPPDSLGGSLLDQVRHRLGDVRIHDGGLAGDLTRRLGARAFTVGRDIYVRPELLRPMTPQSEALLAHELFHVSEQTGVDMPLLRPSPSVSGSAVGARSAGTTSRGTAIQRAPTSDRPAPASISSSEVAAEAIEAQMVRDNAGERASAKPPDPEDVADRVYALMALDLQLDRERAAYGW
jgi:Domain of unknown function (DUF4157)